MADEPTKTETQGEAPPVAERPSTFWAEEGALYRLRLGVIPDVFARNGKWMMDPDVKPWDLTWLSREEAQARLDERGVDGATLDDPVAGVLNELLKKKPGAPEDADA